MKYRVNPKNNDRLSILGFGCMRFPKNQKDTEQQIIYAIENGVNYFDTAYIYPGSEKTLGNILAKGYRERVNIATKMPHHLINKYDDFDKIFNEELKRLQTNYIDYYFMHMLTDINIWNRLIDIGILKWIDEKKGQKQIINIGFSYHGGTEEFQKIVDAYDWEFCMIQYNYLDENEQAGKKGLKYAASKGLPVMIMAPLRGGKLVSNLPKEVYHKLDKSTKKISPVEIALRWLWNQPEVTVVLSGMNTMEMLAENIRIATAAEVDSFTKEDHEMVNNIRNIIKAKNKIPCTGCNYCVPCPMGVDIPTCFACYNDRELEGRVRSIKRYIMNTSLKKHSHNASLCSKCGKCEIRCPQKIAIRDELVKVTKTMESFYYKPVRFFIKKIMKL